MYARLRCIFHRVLQKLLKEHASQKFLGHVQLLMMMQEVCKLDMFLKIYICKRGLWIGVFCIIRLYSNNIQTNICFGSFPFSVSSLTTHLFISIILIIICVSPCWLIFFLCKFPYIYVEVWNSCSIGNLSRHYSGYLSMLLPPKVRTIHFF